MSEQSSSSIGSEAGGGGVGAAASHVPKQAAVVTGAGRHFKRGRNEAEVKFTIANKKATRLASWRNYDASCVVAAIASQKGVL